MSSSSDVEINARWTLDNECPCSREHYYTTEIKWEEVPMYGGAAEGAYWTGRVIVGILTAGVADWFNGGIHNPTHDCVQVTYKCGNCGHSFYTTYELTKNGGKDNRIGYYGLYREIRERSNARRSWAYVESAYDEMWSQWELVNGNCSHWACQFYNSIC